MDTHPETDVFIRNAHIHWGAAFGSGILTGAIAWLLSHGLPWFASGMVSPTLLGRDLKPPGLVDPYASFITILALLLVSVGYALVVAAVVMRLRRIWALAAGALVGIVLYTLNFAVYHLLQGADWRSGTELTVLITHVVFGMIAAGLYKGLAARRMTEHERVM